MIIFNFEKPQNTLQVFGYETNYMWEVDCPFTCMAIGSLNFPGNGDSLGFFAMTNE